jgi:hypothetical protein
MGNQRPVETVTGFVDSALAAFGGSRVYYSRPAMLSGSYEARRLIAVEMKRGTTVARPQIDLYEYHWSYLMAGNKISDLAPTSVRLFLQLPWRLPAALWIYWLMLWVAAIALVREIVRLGSEHKLKSFAVTDIIDAISPDVVYAAVITGVVFIAVGWVTANLVDVVRYLDTSPRSYEARRAIRGGMAELLAALQDPERGYARIAVVAHSLGGYIAYDGLTTLWAQTDRGQDEGRRFNALENLEAKANALPAPSRSGRTFKSTELQAFRDAQHALWQELQTSGTRWLVSDLVTLGTPMYLADLLFTRSRRQFNLLRKRSELAQCPPRSDTESVEGKTPTKLRYRWKGEPLLVTGSPFAAVRWTNLWFPAWAGLFGDPFGGALQPLFGAGIKDRRVSARGLSRFVPIIAHTRYFRFPNQTGAGNVTTELRNAMALEPDPPAAAPRG